MRCVHGQHHDDKHDLPGPYECGIIVVRARARANALRRKQRLRRVQRQCGALGRCCAQTAKGRAEWVQQARKRVVSRRVGNHSLLLLFFIVMFQYFSTGVWTSVHIGKISPSSATWISVLLTMERRSRRPVSAPSASNLITQNTKPTLLPKIHALVDQMWELPPAVTPNERNLLPIDLFLRRHSFGSECQRVQEFFRSSPCIEKDSVSVRVDWIIIPWLWIHGGLCKDNACITKAVIERRVTKAHTHNIPRHSMIECLRSVLFLPNAAARSSAVDIYVWGLIYIYITNTYSMLAARIYLSTLYNHVYKCACMSMGHSTREPVDEPDVRGGARASEMLLGSPWLSCVMVSWCFGDRVRMSYRR